jgi:RcsF protein
MKTIKAPVIGFTCITLLLTACASDYGFNSNLDGAAIDDYFKAGKVTVFDASTLPKAPFKRLKLISAQQCQLTSKEPPVTIADARTELRRQAADIGANGILMKNCQVIETDEQDCFSRALCVGEAISISQESN